MTLIFSNENRILFNVKKTDRLIKLNYGNRFTRLLDSKNSYNIIPTTELQKKLKFKTKTKNYSKTTQKIFYKGAYEKKDLNKKSEQALLEFVKTTKKSCFALQTFSRNEILSLYGLLFNQTVLTQNFLKDCFEKAKWNKAFNSKILTKKKIYTAFKTTNIVSSFATFSFLIPLKIHFSFFSQKKRKCSITQKRQNNEKPTNLKYRNNAYQDPTTTFFITNPISFLKQNVVFVAQNSKSFVPHTIKTTIWNFAFGSSFLLLSMATILQRQNQNRWFFPFLKRQMPGLYQNAQETSWESFETITRKYINRDSTSFRLLSSNDVHQKGKKSQEGILQKKQIFLPFQFTGNRTNRKIQTLIKNVDFYKDQFYIDFSDSWNQQHVQSFVAIFSKPCCCDKNKLFHNSEANQVKKKWKRKKFETSFFVQPAHILNARIPPKKFISKKTFLPMQKEIGLFKIEQYKNRVAIENDSIPSKMASSRVEKKINHFVYSPSEIVKKLFYEYGVFSIATQALQTSSQESLSTEQPSPPSLLAPALFLASFPDEKSYDKSNDLLYNFSISPKEMNQLIKFTDSKYFQQEIVGKLNDKRLFSYQKRKFYTIVNRLPIERISNYGFYKQNNINNRLMSGYQIPEIKTLQLTSKTNKKQLLPFPCPFLPFLPPSCPKEARYITAKEGTGTGGLSAKSIFKEKNIFCNNFTFFSRFQFSLPLFVSPSFSLLDMNKVCIKVPPALPFYESKVQNFLKTLFYSTELFFQTEIKQKEKPNFLSVFSNDRHLHWNKGNIQPCLLNLNQKNQPNKSFKTNYSIKPLKRMPYRKISLKSFQEIKPLFEQVNREVRISPYQFQFKKPLFLDYTDYLSWKKDTPAAISISPSLEEDEAIKTSWDENLETEIQIKQKQNSTSLNFVPFDEIEKDSQQKSRLGKDGKNLERHVDQNEFAFENAMDSQTSFAKNTPNEASQESQTTIGEEEEKKKEITKLEWLLSVREAEQPVEERKDFQKFAYPNKRALFSKNLLIEQGKLENLLVKDRKDSFFGITNLFPKRLIAQDQKQINHQILQNEHDRRKISFLNVLKFKKPDFDRSSSYFLQKSKNHIFVEDILEMGLLSQPLPASTGHDTARQEDLYGSNKSNIWVNAKKGSLSNRIAPRNRETYPDKSLTVLPYDPSSSAIPFSASLEQGKKKEEKGLKQKKANTVTEDTKSHDSATKIFDPSTTVQQNEKTKTKSFFDFASRQHPIYTSNRRLRLRVSESLLSSQNNNPQSRIDDLNLSQSHRWWQKRRTTSSLLGAPSKRYLVMPEITSQDWRNIIEWQLKTYFLEEEKRLQLLVLERAENKKTDLSRSQEKNLLQSSPLCTVSVKGRETDAKNFFKVKKIAIYLPWTTLKKSVKKPFEWPLTSLSYQSSKDCNQQKKNPVQKPTSLNVDRKITLFSTCSRKQDVPKKFATSFTNKKADFCFISSISPQFKTSPLFLFNNNFLIKKPASFSSERNSQNFYLHHSAKKDNRSLFFAKTIDRSEATINHNKLMRQNKTFYSNVTKKQLQKSQIYKPFLFESVTNNSYLLLHQLFLAIAIKELFKSIYKVFGKVIINRIKNSSLAIRFLPIFSNGTSRSKKFNLFYPLKKRFKDLVGSEDTISSLSEIVWYLRNSCRGRMVPHGVVLVETVSSETSDFLKAIGGEAQVPVIVQSLRALPFTQNHPQRHLENILTFAQKKRPCILFLDDLDSIGQSRTLLLKNNRSLKNNFYDEAIPTLSNSSLDLNYLTSHGDGTFEKKKWKKLKNSFKQEYFGVEQDSKFNFKLKQGKESDQSLVSSLLNKKSISQVSHHFLANNFLSNNLSYSFKSPDNAESVYSNKLNAVGDTTSAVNANSQFTPSSIFKRSLSNSNYMPTRDKYEAGQEAKSSREDLTGFITKSNKRLNETEKIVNQRRIDLMLRLLTVMDGISHLNGVLIVTTSKNPSSLDPALLRPGRFERFINLKLPNKKRRIELLKIELSKIGHTNPMPWSYFGTRTQDMTGTEIASAINHSAFRAIIQSTVHTATTLEYGINCVNRENITSSSFERFTKHLQHFGKCKKREIAPSSFLPCFQNKAFFAPSYSTVPCNALKGQKGARRAPFCPFGALQERAPQRGALQGTARYETKFDLRKNCNESFFRRKSRFNKNLESIKVQEEIVNFHQFKNNKNKKRLKTIVVHNPYQTCFEINLKENSFFKHPSKKNKCIFPVCSTKRRTSTQSQLCFFKKNIKSMHYSKAMMDPLKIAMYEISSQISFYQAGKAIMKFGLASQRKCKQVKASDFTLCRRTAYPFSTLGLKVEKNTRVKEKICTNKDMRKSNNLYNAHCYNLTQTDLSQNTIRLYAGQASKLLYLDSIIRLKKKRFLEQNYSQNKRSLYRKKNFRIFFEQLLFLQSDIFHKEKLKATLLIDLMLSNFDMYKKSQVFYPTVKRQKELSRFYLSLFSPSYRAQKKEQGPQDETAKSKKFTKSTRFLFFNKNGFKKKICYQDLRKYLLFNQTAEPDCFVSFSNKTYKDFWWGEKIVETLKIFKQPLGNWYRLYLPRLEQNKSNREWLFPDKIFNQHISLLDLNRLMYHSFAVIPSLTFLQRPVQMQPLLFNSFLTANQSVLFTKCSEKRFESFLKGVRRGTACPSLPLLAVPCPFLPLLAPSGHGTARRDVVPCQSTIGKVDWHVKGHGIANHGNKRERGEVAPTPTCPYLPLPGTAQQTTLPCSLGTSRGTSHKFLAKPLGVKVSFPLRNSMITSNMRKRSRKMFFGSKTKKVKPICNSCQKFYSLQKEKTSKFSYYNMVLSCFYIAFQNCTENRELLDLLADHLIRFKLLKLHEIMRISSFYFY